MTSTVPIWQQILGRSPPPIDAAYQNSVEAAITQAEAGTTAEIVLVVRKQSGSYRDLCWLVGAVAAWIVLWLVLYIPAELHPLYIPFELLGVFLLFAWLTGRSFLRGWFIREQRAERQVIEASRLALLEEGILETPASTGILIYWSRLEQRIEAYADAGIHRQLPAEHWNEFTFRLHQAEKLSDPRPAILEALGQFAPYLAKYLPVTPQHVRVLPNRPRSQP